MTNIDLETLKNERPIEELVRFSIVLIDKPAGWTSFDVVNKVRGIFSSFGVKKAGHFGTLDPQVTGVLPICLQDSCKIQEYFMHKNKTYIGKMKFHKKISREKVEEAMKKFLGKINQLPPVKSRVKRQVRQREIIDFKIIEFNEENQEASFSSKVEAGTYIRKLIHDLGEKLEIGAQMTELRRIEAGIFSEKNTEYTTIENLSKLVREKNLEELKKYLIPSEIILSFIKSFEVSETSVSKLKNGSPLFIEMLKNKEDAEAIKKLTEPFALLSENRIIEIAKTSSQFQNPDIIAKPEVVLVR